MRNVKRGMPVWGLIVVLTMLLSVFGCAVLGENVLSGKEAMCNE